MSRKERDVVKLLLSLAALAMPPACDGAGDDVLEDDTGTDTEIDTEIDTDNCGGIDSDCCPDRTCTDAAAVCVREDTDGEVAYVCRGACTPDLCADEGLEGAACRDVSNGNGLGVCDTVADMGAPMETGNACTSAGASGWGPFNGYCCPVSLGGDGLGFGEGDGEAGLASMCDGVDMSTLASATSYDELIHCGVGVCLMNLTDTDERWCAAPCAFDNTCDLLHVCTPFESTGEQGGYCAPYEV